MKRTRLALVAAMALVATSCADLKVQLQYAPDSRIEKVAAGVSVTVFRFTDARGDEGDEGDVYRVGGVLVEPKEIAALIERIEREGQR